MYRLELRGIPEEGVDCDAVASVWEKALRAPGWDGPQVWLHAGRCEALIALPYYRGTNPAMASTARHVIRAVLDDG